MRLLNSLLCAVILVFCAAFASAAVPAIQPVRALQIYQPGMQGQTITCSSNDGNRHYCNVNTQRGVRLSRQISGSACIETRTWGYDTRGIWVDKGCRAEFVVGAGRGNGGRQQGQTITCSSDNGDRNYCSIPNNVNLNNINMTRQISGSPCIQGRTWGVDGRGLWVDKGCRAEFSTRGNGFGFQRPPSQPFTCSSNDGGRKYCSFPSGVNPNRIRMTRQISGSACVQGQTWGVDRRGLWVDHGCRAEFRSY